MIEVIKGKIYISQERLSLSDLSHPNGVHEPVTALIIIGNAKLKCQPALVPFHTDVKEVDCGDPFDPSEWNDKVNKGNKKEFYSVQDKTLDEDNKARYRDVASGNYALVMKHYHTLNSFLKDGEAAYHFWLYSQHGKLCIVVENPIDGIAIVQAFALQARKLQGLMDIDHKKLRSENPNINALINMFPEFTEDEFSNINFSTTKVLSVVDAAYVRRYATAACSAKEEPDIFIGKIKKILDDYHAKRANSSSAVYKLRLLSQQVYFLQSLLAERLRQDSTSTTFISLAIIVEHVLYRPEAWEERNLYSASSGGKFIKMQRKIFQMVLNYLQISRDNVFASQQANFEDVHEALVKSAQSSSAPRVIKIGFFDSNDSFFPMPKTDPNQSFVPEMNYEDDTTPDDSTIAEANRIAERFRK